MIKVNNTSFEWKEGLRLGEVIDQFIKTYFSA